MTDHLDDLPKRDENHKIQTAAENALRKSVEKFGMFIVQHVDSSDYGSDFQLEVTKDRLVTNIRIHAQLKGTRANFQSDGSITRQIYRSNLNYLLQQTSSIYVCFHEPTQKLMVRFADDIFREYEHKGSSWSTKKTITVRFYEEFNKEFQKKLRNLALASTRGAKLDRLDLISSPPEKIRSVIRKTMRKVDVPLVEERAIKILEELYLSGDDDVISNSFEQFYAVIGHLPKAICPAYMAEFNLGVSGFSVDRDRIIKGISEIENLVNKNEFEAGTLLYCVGNGYLALKEYEKSREIYNRALLQLDKPGLEEAAARCSKNMGSVMEALGKDPATAIAFYERALSLRPQLSEAHFALALCFRKSKNFYKMLEHLDSINFIGRDSRHNVTLQGWRIEALFETRDFIGAFREINSLISQAENYGWIWFWCVKVVRAYGRSMLDSTRKSVVFWDVYLQQFPDDTSAKKERLLCALSWRFYEMVPNWTFERFQSEAIDVIDGDLAGTAFLWDRIGHWAQCDERWDAAVNAYRKAYEIEPGRYAYCLGAALNFLREFEGSLSILSQHVESDYSTDQSWFQLAVAFEGVGDIDGCISAYKKAIEINPDYDLAWFNLGGIYWNNGKRDEAFEVWVSALEKFPEHPLAKKLKSDFQFLFS